MNAGFQPRSSEDLSILLKKDTVSVLQKLKRSLLFEIIFACLFTLGCTFMIVFTDSWQYHTLFIILGVMGIAFNIVLLLLLRKMNTVVQTSTVKQNLAKLVRIIEEYSKRYLQLTIFLLPACFALGVWLSYNDPENVLRPPDGKLISILTIAMLVAGIAIYLFTRWYLKKLYGNYILQLKELLKEFDEE